jgi:hypothetical protein
MFDIQALQYIIFISTLQLENCNRHRYETNMVRNS